VNKWESYYEDITQLKDSYKEEHLPPMVVVNATQTSDMDISWQMYLLFWAMNVANGK
jgi:hypothetical protein